MSSHYSSSLDPSHHGSAYSWILEQLLAYPGSYEIPLRTMYTLNSAPSALQQPRQSLRPDTSSLSSSQSSLDGSPKTPEFPLDQKHQLPQGHSGDHFKQCLMEHISHLPSQPFSLPPSFITSFVRRCFTEDLCMVDFTQALTAMDYLKDLDGRQRRELDAALRRLGVIKQNTQEQNRSPGHNPRIMEWAKSIQDKQRKVEALFTQVYIGVRRWTLINEMRLEPFNKANSIAMLNTLYPPAAAAAPTRQLTPAILNSQRKAFFRYITGVEQNGKGILKNLEHQGQRPGDANGWAVVRDIIDKYLRTANGLIEECAEVSGPEFFTAEAELYRRSDRRADSGVSFATGDRPSTSSSNHSGLSGSFSKHLPAQPIHLQQSHTIPPTSPKKRGTTLEKIAREFRNLRSRDDVKELTYNKVRTNSDLDYYTAAITNNSKEPAKGFLGLRKMKSTSSVGSRDHSTSSRSQGHHSRSGSGSDQPLPTFDLEARRRQMITEARLAKEKKAAEKGSNGSIPFPRPGGAGRSLEISAQ